MVNTPPFKQGLIKDNQAGRVQKVQDIERNGSMDAMRQENTEPDALRRENIERNASIDAMRHKRQSHWNQGHCEQCKNDFKKVTSWQKFCCADCRKVAYELRTGKVWRNRKTVG